MTNALIRPIAFPTFERDGLRAVERANSTIVALSARNGMREQLLDQVGAAFGIRLPDGLGCVRGSDLTIIASAPDAWLCVKDEGGDRWAGECAAALRGIASIVDQSGAYVRVCLEGRRAREVLQKGVYLDLHPAIFGPGAAAQTSVAHVNILLWRPDGGPSYELAIPRSYVLAFRHWLEAAAVL